jgi:hypothetical protein
MDEGIQRFAARLQETLGGSLRGVFYGDFRKQEYNVAYAREDALEGYGPGHIEDVVDDVALDALNADRKETLHEPIAPLRTTVEVYEDGINVVVLGYGDVGAVTPTLEVVEAVLA